MISYDVLPYQTADTLAACYHSKIKRAMELMAEFEQTMADLNTTFGIIGHNKAFEYKIEIQGKQEAKNILRETKRRAWKVLVGKLGIERIMSPKRRQEMDEAFREHSGRGEDPIDQFPDIDPDNIFSVLQGYCATASEFLDEAIQDVYEFLKPWNRDELKTNAKNRWKLSNKVIIVHACEQRWGKGSGFHVNWGDRGNKIHALCNVFHLLDGKGIPGEHHGKLVSAINATGPDGRGETEYFRFRCCKNMNLHIEFKRPDLVQEFNLRCGNPMQLPGKADGKYNRGTPESRVPDAQPPLAPNGDLNFFRTPFSEVAEMIEIADVRAGQNVLEPSAGDGRIAISCRSAGANVVCVEVDSERARQLKQIGFETLPANFLDLPAEPIYDAVLMNPPFSHKRDMAHIQHAWQFVKPGGVLIAIAASGFQHRQDKASSEFREWLETNNVEIHEHPEHLFRESGTDVHTVRLVARR